MAPKQWLKQVYSHYLKRSQLLDRFFKPKPIDVIRTFNFVAAVPFGEAIADSIDLDPKTINWVIPDFDSGSGGHLNIFRLIAHLEKQGYCCRVVIAGSCRFSSSQSAYRFICEHFNLIKAQVFIGVETMPPALITVATSWITAFVVRNFRSTVIKCYFVQDFEPFFYPHGSEFALAEQTYRFGFHGITAGQWLADKLYRDYGMKTNAIGFSFDRHLYRPYPRRNPTRKQVFFYARQATPRRGFELGILVLAEVARRLPEVQFVLAGCDTSQYDLPFKHTNAGVLPIKELPDLYSQCDAALVLSFTNLSLLPLELMACGCPVVSNKGANVECLLSQNHAILAEPTVEALSNGILVLMQDDLYRHQLIHAGLDFANATDWEIESRKVATMFEQLTNEV